MEHHQFKIGEHVLVEQGSLRHGVWRKLRGHVPGAGNSSRLALRDQSKHQMLPTGREGASAAKRRAQSTSQTILTSSHDNSCTRAIARWNDAGRAPLPGSGETRDDVSQLTPRLGPMPIHRRVASVTLWDALSSKVWRNLHEGEQHYAVRS